MTLAPWTHKAGYLNTASFGIPCAAARDAVNAMTSNWAEGALGFGGWLEEAQRARSSIAAWFKVPVEWVALGNSTAVMLSSIAAGLERGSQVLAPENEHNSNLIPYVNQAQRQISVTVKPLRELAACVAPPTSLVSCAAVQSLTGEVADLVALGAACAAAGSLLCVDASQACGWLPLSGASADIIVCSVYKWLCSPIGGAFLIMRPEIAERFKPATPSWAACVNAMAPPYGVDFPMAPGTRRFDTVPNLISMIAVKQNLDAMIKIGVDRIYAHDVGLANRFRTAMGMEDSNSAIVTLAWEGAAAELAKSGIKATEWRGNLRLAFHLHNDESDVDAAVTCLLAMRERGRA